MSIIKTVATFSLMTVFGMAVLGATAFPAQAYVQEGAVIYGPRQHPTWNGDYYPRHREYYVRQRGYYPPPPPVVLMPPPILPGVSIILPFGVR